MSNKLDKKDEPKTAFIPEIELPDCSQHKKEIAGISDMKVLAEMIGDLHYETLTDFLHQLAIKINLDGVNDTNSGRKELGRHLYFASTHLESAFECIQECCIISKPFMRETTVSSAPPISKEDEAVRFAEWINRDYIKILDKWCMKYNDIHDRSKHKTSKQLFQLFKEDEKLK